MGHSQSRDSWDPVLVHDSYTKHRKSSDGAGSGLVVHGAVCLVKGPCGHIIAYAHMRIVVRIMHMHIK